MGSRRWSIFTGGESGLGGRGACGVGRRKGAVGPSLVAQITEFGQDHLCLGLCGCHVRSEGWLGERERQKITNAGPSSAALRDWLPGELIAEVKVDVCEVLWEYPELQ